MSREEQGELQPLLSKDDSISAPLPWGSSWRSSTWYLTSVVTFGIATDAICYLIIIPVVPFRLQFLGYDNISARASWFLFAYSLGVVIFTFPLTFILHRQPWRRGPLIAAVIVMQLSLVIFMLVQHYWVMIFARVLQGISNTVIWSVGFALICENVDEERVGRQLGFAISGVAIGNVIGPPVGGALYDSLGWHAPFVFCIIICGIELGARWLVLERRNLAPTTSVSTSKSEPCSPSPGLEEDNMVSPGLLFLEGIGAELVVKQSKPASTTTNDNGVELSPWDVIATLVTSSRGMTAISLHVLFGLIVGAYDPTFTLRVRDVWGKDSSFIGLAYLAALSPAFICGPITGWLSDKLGAEWIMGPSVLLTAPFCLLMLYKESLAGFIMSFGMIDLFLSCMLTPVGVEVAAVARNQEGISEIHQFGALNVAYALATAIGAVVGGQFYNDLPNGWNAVCWFCFACCIAAIPATLIYAGDRPLLLRLFSRASRANPDPTVM